MKRESNRFSKEFMDWYKEFLEKNNLKREQIFGDKKDTWDINHGEEVIMIGVNTLYEAFKGGKKVGRRNRKDNITNKRIKKERTSTC